MSDKSEIARNKGIVGTSSPLILIAEVHYPSGVQGTVYVGQQIITALIKCKSVIKNVPPDEKRPAPVWCINVWDTRNPDREDMVMQFTGGGQPTLEDVRRVDLAVEEWLRDNG